MAVSVIGLFLTLAMMGVRAMISHVHLVYLIVSLRIQTRCQRMSAWGRGIEEHRDGKQYDQPFCHLKQITPVDEICQIASYEMTERSLPTLMKASTH